ncbi:MAG: hypothetical protein KA059_07865 [Elusimicrobiales bacterium]|nr:hypothetical protein [Elusimicrobiales bacterium]
MKLLVLALSLTGSVYAGTNVNRDVNINNVVNSSNAFDQNVNVNNVVNNVNNHNSNNNVNVNNIINTANGFGQDVDVNNIVNNSNNVALPNPRAVPGGIRDTRDCARFDFGPSDSDMMSDKVWLRSDEYITECNTIYVPGANGQPVPQQNCYERLAYTYRSQVQINIKQRNLLPWERESFDVCMQGQWIDIYIVQAGYKYSISKKGYGDVLFTLTPQNKIAMNPDVEGLSYTEFSYNKDTKKYTFKVSDKWAKEYAGEKVYIKLELKKDISNWFDSSLGTKEFTFDTSNNYTMEFSEDELVKPNTNNDNNYRGDKLFDNKGFYLKWGFKRLGTISKDKYMDKGETVRVQK